MKEFLDVSLFGGAVLSLVAYEIGLILKKKFKMAVFNPLLIGVICVIAVLVVGNISYEFIIQVEIHQLSFNTGYCLPRSAVV